MMSMPMRFMCLCLAIATSAMLGHAQTNTFPASGNVGIGITDPGAKLDVDGVSDTAGYIVTRMSSQTSGYPAYLQFTDGFTYNYAIGTAGNGDMTFNIARFPGTAGTERVRITQSGNVGIGTTNPQYPLSVNGMIQAKEVLVNTGWSDYVFDPAYRIKPLTEVAAFIKANHHLPDIPSEAEVKEKGVSLGDMQSKLLAKIEELTLQMIQLNETNKALEKRVAHLEGH